MGRGRPPKPGTAEEKAAARRERVRNNVRALRERRKQAASTGPSFAGGRSFRLERIQDDYAPISSKQKRENSHSDDETSHKGAIKVDESTHGSTRTSALYLVNQRTVARTMVPPNIDTKHQYASAMLATVRTGFLPDAVYLPPDAKSATVRPWESEQLLWTPCAFWVTSAFTRASNQDYSVLKSSLLSIGMLLKGLEHQDQSLKLAAMEMYRRSLRGIRETIDPIIQGRPEKPKDVMAIYLSCHAAAMFELIQNADLSATMRHLRGVSQLICHLGDGTTEEEQSMAWLLLQDYRFAEMGVCLKYRYSSYSTIARQKFEEASIETNAPEDSPAPTKARESHNMLVTLTDIADVLCAIMVRIDLLKSTSSNSSKSKRVRQCLADLDKVWQRFPHLHNRLTQRYGNDFVYKDENEDDSSETSYRFKTFDVGAAWCYNLMTQLYCLETSIEVTTLLLKTERDLSSNASSSDHRDCSISQCTTADSAEESTTLDRLHECRRLHRVTCIQLTHCLLYFLQTDKGIAGQALAIYPLDAAINMLNVETKRLEVDLKEAHLARKGKERITMVWKDFISIANATTFVQKMQERAKQFGLPSFHENTPQKVVVEPQVLQDPG